MPRLDIHVVAGAAAATILGGLILFWNLDGYALWDPDEARHAEVAREVFTAAGWRSWIVPSLNFRPYYDKPILFYWIVSAAYAVGGVNELAARAVPAGAALIVILAIYLWAARAWNPRAGFAAAAVLATAGEFVALGRYANLDMLFTLWITLGLLAVHRWTRRAEAGATLTAAAVYAALGMLTKGLAAAVLIGGISLSYLAVTHQLPLLRHARLLRSAVGFFLVAGPWYLTVAVVDPDYLHEFFFRHHYQRFFEDVRYLHPGPVYYYLPMLLLCMFPWSVLLPATVRGTLGRERRGRTELFCACWALGIIVFFSLARGKLGTYILPALPPLALLTGRYVDDLLGRRNLPALERRLVAGGIIVAAVACVVAAPVLAALSARIYNGAWIKTSLLATVMIPVGIVLLVFLRRGWHHATPIPLAAGIAGGFLVFYTWAGPSISAVRSEAPLAAAIAHGAARDRSAVAPIVAYSVRTPSLLFYLQRPVHEIDRPKRLERILAEHPLVFVVTSPKHVPIVAAAGTLFPWYTEARHVLYATQPPRPPDGDDGAHAGT